MDVEAPTSGIRQDSGPRRLLLLEAYELEAYEHKPKDTPLASSFSATARGVRFGSQQNSGPNKITTNGLFNPRRFPPDATE